MIKLMTKMCGGMKWRCQSILKPYQISFLAVVILLMITDQAFSQNCFLSTVGSQVRNNAGQNVVLRAMNLGYWTVQEGYMMNPQNGNLVNCEWKMKKRYFDAGQTEAQVEAFYQS